MKQSWRLACTMSELIQIRPTSLLIKTCPKEAALQASASQSLQSNGLTSNVVKARCLAPCSGAQKLRLNESVSRMMSFLLVKCTSQGEHAQQDPG